MEPSNVMMGDVPQPINLPEMPNQQRAAAEAELRRKAKYSRSTEFRELQTKMEERIKFYQSFLPGGVPVVTITEEERGKYWAVADLVIAELQAVINMYQEADNQAKQLK